MVSDASNTLRQWLESGSLSVKQYQAAVKQFGGRPTAKNWWAFFQLVTMVLAAGALVFSLLFFIAFNWADMSHFAKFAMAQSALLLSVAGYFYRVRFKQDESDVVGWLMVTIAVLLGGLFALFGQVYQTGADSWQLFSTWTIAIAPLVVVSRFMPLWVLWMMLVNLTFTLFYEQMRLTVPWLDRSAFGSLQVALNTLFLVGLEWIKTKRYVLKPAAYTRQNCWLTRFLVMINLVLLCSHLVSIWNEFNGLIMLTPMWIAVAMLYYYFLRRDIFSLGFCVLAAAVYIVWMGNQYIYPNLNPLADMFIGAFIFFSIGMLGSYWLRALAKSNATKFTSVALESNTSAVDDNAKASIWWQLQQVQIVESDAPVPNVSGLSARNIMGVFSVLAALVGIFLMGALTLLYPSILESGLMQFFFLIFCSLFGYSLAKETQQRSDLYIPAVVMFILAQLFILLCIDTSGIDEVWAACVYFVCAVIQLLWFSLNSMRFMLLIFAGIALVYCCHLLKIDGLSVIFFMAIWLYLVVNENQLIDRFGMSRLNPFYQGLFGVLLLSAITNTFEYQLFSANAGSLSQQISFVIMSLGCFGLFVYFAFNMMPTNSRRYFNNIGTVLLLMLTLLLCFCVPSVTVALAIMMAGIYLQRQFWLLAGGLSLLYFIGEFYYDLDATLNTKSLFLLCFATGVIGLRYAAKWQFAHLGLVKEDDKNG